MGQPVQPPMHLGWKGGDTWVERFPRQALAITARRLYF